MSNAKLTKVSSKGFTFEEDLQARKDAIRTLKMRVTYLYNPIFTNNCIQTECLNCKTTSPTENIVIYYRYSYLRFQELGSANGAQRKRNVAHVVNAFTSGRAAILSIRDEMKIQKSFGKLYDKLFDSYIGLEEEKPKPKKAKGKKVELTNA